MYLLDSDYIINFLRNKKHAVGFINTNKNVNLYTSVICAAEVLEGLSFSSKAKERKVKIFLSALKTINVDQGIVEVFSKIRGDLRKKGKLIDNFDLLIASTCLVHDLTLVTENIDHFKRIPKLKIYKEKN